MSFYLRNRSGNYHLRIRVPLDLVPQLSSVELVKSLKTKDKKTAKMSALPYLKSITQTFSLLRSGYISEGQARDNLEGLLSRVGGRKAKCVETAQAASQVMAVVPTLPLSVVASQFIKDRQHEWKIKTTMEVEGIFKVVVDLLADMDVKMIDRGTARELRDKLIRLPANIYKLYPNKNAAEVMVLIERGIITPKVISITSVNKYLLWFTSLMIFCVGEGYIKDNPSIGLSIKQNRRPEEERKAYDKGDLNKIIEHLPKMHSCTPERHWIPLIALYAGLRLDEVCQLYLEDVKKVDGIWCIDVNDEKDKKLKTLSSKRLVPIHSMLIEAGLIAYAQSVKGDRLWPALKWRAADGYCSAYGKIFQRFNRQHITSDLKKCFHSFRHTFINTLKQSGIDEVKIAELVGHANSSMTTGRYGKRYEVEKLKETIDLLVYEGVDLWML